MPDSIVGRLPDVPAARPISEPPVVPGDGEPFDPLARQSDTAPQPRIAADESARADEPARAVAPIHAAWDMQSTFKVTNVGSRRVFFGDPKLPRSPLVVLPAMILLTGIAAFFSWVSAEPFWISVGHHITGTVTVNECQAEGFAPRCEGRFLPDSGGDSQPVMRISGDTHAERQGETVAAQAVSSDSTSAYIGNDTGLVLRWSLGLAIVITCGFVIAWVSDAWRFTGRMRIGAVTASVAGPLLIWLGALALTW